MTTYYHHPEFLRLSKLTYDFQLKELFNKCAQDKFPPHIKYDNGVISSKYGGEYKLTDNPQKDLKKIHAVIYKNKKRKDDIDVCNEWKKIKPKSKKENCLLKYVSDVQEKYSLGRKTTKILYDMLYYSIMFKEITNGDIKVKNGVIKDITPLEIKKGKINLKCTRHKDKLHNITKPKEVLFESYLDKYIKELPYKFIK